MERQSILPILRDMAWHSSALNVQLFGGAGCDSGHYKHLVAAKVRKRLVVSKQTLNKLHMERFNFKKLNMVGG
jgi:hypothetical protein